MMKWLWGGMLVLALVFGCIGDNPAGLVDDMAAGAGEAVSLCLSLAGAYMLWMGLMKIAERAGLIKSLSRAVQPMLHRLFRASQDAVAPITLNLAANFFGMGSAATPFGLAAMRELEKSNRKKGTATDDMCMFLSLNSAALELLPTSVIALRVASGSADAYCVVVPTFIASIFAFASAIVACKLFVRFSRTKNP
ncbi:MAG: nucleoside recognition domain-containing protein [Clostridia bacterium]